VVAGTGSIAYGRCCGREMRTGGWGSWIGDEGSAYYIGAETLRIFSMQMDKRLEKTLIFDTVKEHLGIRDHYDFVEWVYSGDRRKRIASVAKITHEAAKLKDPHALKILKESGRYLSQLAIAIAENLEMPSPAITYSGSVLEKNEIVREAFTEELKKSLKSFSLSPLKIRPVYGAIVLGFLENGKSLPKAFYRNTGIEPY
jgi:N-acetylglucosamine kinase-like BadF-type ATPase